MEAPPPRGEESLGGRWMEIYIILLIIAEIIRMMLPYRYLAGLSQVFRHPELSDVDGPLNGGLWARVNSY